jgi:S-adenosylmethionine:tRNA ribosyltransferase-isomerase
MLLRPIAGQGNCWDALGRPFRKLQEGFRIEFPGNCTATILRQELNGTQPYVEVNFDLPHEEFSNWIDQEGYIPLPPYIARPQAVNAEQSPDRERYQTVYAMERGSVAAPTAGLHFDKQSWEKLHEAGIETAPVTLHVGGGTFLPVKSAEISQHKMHKESFRMSHRTFDCINSALKDTRPIVAIGTTTLRCVESFALVKKEKGSEYALNNWLDTDLFIYPKHREDTYQPWAIQGLMTNFHQPESSLLMLVSSLVGYESMKKIYSEAVAQKYRFLSYGDTSLLWF